MGWFWPTLAVLALWGGITMWRRVRDEAAPGVRVPGPGTGVVGDRRSEDDAIDWKTLEAAEREVQDLGPGEEPPEWGPGTAKPPLIG